MVIERHSFTNLIQLLLRKPPRRIVFLEDKLLRVQVLEMPLPEQRRLTCRQARVRGRTEPSIKAAAMFGEIGISVQKGISWIVDELFGIALVRAEAVVSFLRQGEAVKAQR